MVTRATPIQRFPTSGPLAGATNMDLTALRQMLKGQSGVVHCYVVKTVEYRDAEFVQTGSGPNFEGGLITLCTCKRQMRSRKSASDWRGAWVAGFTSVGKVPGEHVNHLVYFTKIRQAYDSHRDLWSALTPAQRFIKATDRNPLGDVFQPRVPVGDWFDPQSYVPPSPEHVHCPDHYWLRDIDDHRHPPLLAGDPESSFLWNKPIVSWSKSRVARDYEQHSVAELLALLS